MFYKFPYTDLYNLNLDWIVTEIKKVQNMITNLGSVVNTFNSRSGDVTLQASDVNALAINSVMRLSADVDPEAFPAATLKTFYDNGIRLLIQPNNTGTYDRAYMLVLNNNDVDLLFFDPRGENAGVVTVNGMRGEVTLTGDDIPTASDSPIPLTTFISDSMEQLLSDVDALNKATIELFTLYVTEVHPAIEYGSYFVYQEKMYRAIDDIVQDGLITPENAEEVTGGALTDLYNRLLSQIQQLDEFLFPEGGGTPGQFLQTDSEGATVWGGPASETAIAAAVTDWLDENVPTGTTVVIDKSLTVSDAAADSQVVGIYIDNLTKATFQQFDMEQGGLQNSGRPQPPDHQSYNICIRTQKYIPVFDDTQYICPMINNDYQYSASFYTTADDYTHRIGYTPWIELNTPFTTPATTKYIRITIRKKTNAAITPNEFQKVQLCIQNNHYPDIIHTDHADLDLLTSSIMVRTNISNWSYGTFNANGTINTLYNGCVCDITPFVPTTIITFPEKSYCVLAFYDADNTYIGKVAANGSINKTAGDWMYFFHNITIRNYAPENAVMFRVGIIPTDGTILTPDSVNDWGSTNITLAEFAGIGNNIQTPVSYAVDATGLKTALKTNLLGVLTYHQSFCIYNDKIYSTDGSNIGVQDMQFTPISTTAIAVGHGNNFQLGHNGKAYISGWSDQKIYVLDLETLTIDRIITLPTSGYTTAVVDDLNNIAYIFQRDTYPTTVEHYKFITFDIANNTVISTRIINAFSAMQAADLYNGKIVISWGLATGTSPTGMAVYNTVGDMLVNFDISEINNLEPEGIFYDRNTGKIIFSTVAKNVYEIINV